MTDNTPDTRLDEYFQRINESYAELIEGNEQRLKEIKSIKETKDNKPILLFLKDNNVLFGELVTEIWKMLEHTRYKNQMQFHTVEIMETIKSSIKSYDFIAKKGSYSKYLYALLRDYAFVKKNTEDIGEQYDYHIKDALKKKIKTVKGFIEDFQQLHCREVHSADEKVVIWISKQTGYSTEEVKLIIDYINQAKISINSTGEEASAGLEVIDNSENDVELQKHYIQLFLEKAEIQLKNERKKTEVKNIIATMFTWKILSECSVLPEDDLKDVLTDDSAKIIDKKLLKDFFDGKYRDDFNQKRIAEERGVDKSYANRLMKDFLNKLDIEFRELNDLEI